MNDLFSSLEMHEQKSALLSEESGEMSYHDLACQADFWANAVAGRNLVLILCENCPEAVMAYIGLMRANSVPALVHHSVSQHHLVDITNRLNPGYILCPLNHAPTFGQARIVQQRNGYVLMHRGESPAMHDQLSLLLTTSGSTGSRSFVRISRNNILSNAASIAQSLDLKESDRAITTMPFSYSYGLSIIHSHLLVGASVFVTENAVITPAFWHAVREHRVTNFGGVPFIYQTLKRLHLDTMDLPALRLLTQAGGRMDPDDIQSFVRSCTHKNRQFRVMYGQTEATARMSCVPWDAMPSKGHTIGIPIPGGSMFLIDEAGNPIQEPEQPGELVYQGPNVSLGLAQSADDLTLGDCHKGTLHTGDIACRDSDGFLRIIGRKKRFLKIFGHRVSLDETEHLLEKAGYHAACSGHDDRLCVFITDADKAKDVAAFLQSATGLHHKGIFVHIVPAFPRLESGKTDYSTLMNQAVP
ncbi:AMP-binding protein [Haematospirillum sp. H1815]|uniref:AMP-binding protein n=1 Tax=Haematospirillum sp. H1815 TaxID=2723108 RepID=UPI00143B1402|nr:AMP-binding protein [Haematospirillum sp. H1815]NKD77965.1 AMP-binding protein [Haematospirillum sp. H1815]